jgi:hypothetical protein
MRVGIGSAHGMKDSVDVLRSGTKAWASIVRTPVKIENARGGKRLQRRRPHRDTSVRGPAVEHQAPALRDEREPGLRLDMQARRRNERPDQRIIVRCLETQEGFRLGERQRLGRRRCEKNGCHYDVPKIARARAIPAAGFGPPPEG